MNVVGTKPLIAAITADTALRDDGTATFGLELRRCCTASGQQTIVEWQGGSCSP